MPGLSFPIPGRASFASANYHDIELLSGEGDLKTTNEKKTIPAAGLNLPIYSVVGLDANDEIVLATHVVTDPISAMGHLLLKANPTAGDTVTIGDHVYTFVSSLTAANDVLIGANADDTAANLNAAINAGAGAGTTYGTGTVANAYVTSTTEVMATVADGGSVSVTAILDGAAGNGIDLAASLTGGATTGLWAVQNERVLVAATPTYEDPAAITETFGGLDPQGGIRAFGITTSELVYAASESGNVVNCPVYRTGTFNPNALWWDASFDSDEKRKKAFEGGNSPLLFIHRPVTQDSTVYARVPTTA